MGDNTNLIAAVKDAENAIAKALNTLKEIASELPKTQKQTQETRRFNITLTISNSCVSAENAANRLSDASI